MKVRCSRIKAVLLLVLTLSCLIGTQLAVTQGNMFAIADIFIEDGTVANYVLTVTGWVSAGGVEAAAIILCVNPWLGLGLGLSYAA